MKRLLICVAFVLAACSAPPSSKGPGRDVVIEGFRGFHSEGASPVFDLKARAARMDEQSRWVGLSGVHVDLFDQGRPAGTLTAEAGSFDPDEKRIELYEDVAYHHKMRGVFLQAEKMVWDNIRGALYGETDVRGTYQGKSFKGHYLEAYHGQREIRVHQAVFVDAG